MEAFIFIVVVAAVLIFVAYRHGKLQGYIKHAKEIEQSLIGDGPGEHVIGLLKKLDTMLAVKKSTPVEPQKVEAPAQAKDGVIQA